MVCEDCGNDFDKKDGGFYKYENVWLCDDCHDERMEG